MRRDGRRVLPLDGALARRCAAAGRRRPPPGAAGPREILARPASRPRRRRRPVGRALPRARGLPVDDSDLAAQAERARRVPRRRPLAGLTASDPVARVALRPAHARCTRSDAGRRRDGGGRHAGRGGSGRQRAAEARRADDRGRASGPTSAWPAERSLRSALEHELVISHGNGPQVGLLSLQASAVRRGVDVPVRRPRGADRGDDRLLHRAGARQHGAVREADRDDPHDDRGRPRRPGDEGPDEVRRAGLHRGAPHGGSPPSGAGRSSPTATHWRRVVPSPLPQADLRDPPDHAAARGRDDRHLHRWRRDPDDVPARGAARLRRRPQHAHARGRRGGDRQGPVLGRARAGPAAPTCSSSRPTPTRSTSTGGRRSSARWPTASPDAISAPQPFPAGSMGPKVEAACRVRALRARARSPRSARSPTSAGILAGTHGTQVTADVDGLSTR